MAGISMAGGCKPPMLLPLLGLGPGISTIGTAPAITRGLQGQSRFFQPTHIIMSRRQGLNQSTLGAVGAPPTAAAAAATPTPHNPNHISTGAAALALALGHAGGRGGPPGAGGGAVTRVSRMPTPSIMASSTPPNAADLPADRSPVRSCRKPPAEWGGQARAGSTFNHVHSQVAACWYQSWRVHGACLPGAAQSSPPQSSTARHRAAQCVQHPPVSAPAAMLFHGSSFLRRATRVQSKVENRPPHTAKLPPMRGASRRMACKRRPHIAQVGRRWQVRGRWGQRRRQKPQGGS